MHYICKKVQVMVFAQLEAQHLSTLNSHHSHRVMAVESEINQGKKPSSLFLCHSANINSTDYTTVNLVIKSTKKGKGKPNDFFLKYATILSVFFNTVYLGNNGSAKM